MISPPLPAADKVSVFQTQPGAFKKRSVNGIFWCLISTGVFFFWDGWRGGAADVPVLPAHHQERADSDRGAAHQNAIRTPLATRLPD